MLTEILIDPNVRVEDNLTFSGFEDVIGDIPREGEYVVVREPEGNLSTIGHVQRVDQHDELVYLAVNWRTLVPDWVPSQDQLMQLMVQVTTENFPVRSQVTETATSGTSAIFNQYLETDLLLTA
jgi:hypothetical protein